MMTQRSSGILLHPTSLPSALGAGDFGPEAYRFIDWLHSAGQTYWQMLPLGEVGPGNSPYMSCSAFAGNVLLIDLLELSEHGWLRDDDVQAHPDFRAEKINYALLHPYRMERLRRAAKAFFSQQNVLHTAAYQQFCSDAAGWLNDYALFMALEEREQWRNWNEWPSALAQRDAQALQQATEECAEEIHFWKFCQWCFARQWDKLKHYAHQHGVRLVGDVPIFVAYQSADVWAHQALFELDEHGKSTVVAGVPPDYFSTTGQLWGNPLYRWSAHEQSGYTWWIARLRHALSLFDLVRIDHFRGFAGYWAVPAGAPNAIGGQWLTGPGAKLFEAFQQALGELPIIAEDLGLITPDVIALRDQFNLPGMRILQFAFGDTDANLFLPHHYIPNCIAYTGTHDNDTTLGWWHTTRPEVRAFAQKYLHSDGQAIHWDMIKALSASVANTVIYPLQDVLGLGGEHRMNYPGQADGNWAWRFTWDMVKPEQTQRLAEITATYARTASVN